MALGHLQWISDNILMLFATQVLLELVLGIISSTVAQEPGKEKKLTLCWAFTSTELEIDVFV